jgi:hypothetical protein
MFMFTLDVVRVISGVYGGAGAGAAGYGGGAGPVITMINQVQMISMLGRTGGDQGFSSNKVFSNGFVWSNLDANLDAATGDRAQGASPCVGTLCVNTDLLSIIASAIMTRMGPGADVVIGLGIESCICLCMFCVRLCLRERAYICARVYLLACVMQTLCVGKKNYPPANATPTPGPIY